MNTRWITWGAALGIAALGCVTPGATYRHEQTEERRETYAEEAPPDGGSSAPQAPLAEPPAARYEPPADEPYEAPPEPPADAPVWSPSEPAEGEEPRSCCKICRKGCACGNTCISCSKTCRVGRGCACDG